VSAASTPALDLDAPGGLRMLPCRSCGREVREDLAHVVSAPRERAIAAGEVLCSRQCEHVATAAAMRKIACSAGCDAYIDPHGTEGEPGFTTPAKRYCSPACKARWRDVLRQAETRIARQEVPSRPGPGSSIADFEAALQRIRGAMRGVEVWRAVMLGERDGEVTLQRGTEAARQALGAAASLHLRLSTAERVALDDERVARNAVAAAGTDADRAAAAARQAERQAVADEVARLDHRDVKL
jgi:hypothetical protein